MAAMKSEVTAPLGVAGAGDADSIGRPGPDMQSLLLVLGPQRATGPAAAGGHAHLPHPHVRLHGRRSGCSHSGGIQGSVQMPTHDGRSFSGPWLDGHRECAPACLDLEVCNGSLISSDEIAGL